MEIITTIMVKYLTTSHMVRLISISSNYLICSPSSTRATQWPLASYRTRRTVLSITIDTIDRTVTLIQCKILTSLQRALKLNEMFRALKSKEQNTCYKMLIWHSHISSLEK